MLIELGVSYSKWQYGVKSPIYWDTDSVPHCMIAGVTGGGKSVLTQIIVNKLLDEKKDISICDFKAGGDWDNITLNYAEYVECDNILNSFYESFNDAIHKKQYRERYLIFDEFSSYASNKDTKEFKDMMNKISHIAYMGRSFGYHLVLISQQFSGKVIDTSVREQCGIKIYMGRKISKESAMMLFPDCEIDKSIHLPKCCGYISTLDNDLEIIQIPFVSEPAKLKKLLMEKGQKYFK